MHQRKTDATDRVRGAAEPRAAPARGRTRSLSLRRAGSRCAVHQCVCRVPCQVVAPIPWACHYDANMEPWSPFKDTPEIPIVRPRTAMLMMRKMLLSNPAAGLSDAAPPPHTQHLPGTLHRPHAISIPAARARQVALAPGNVGGARLAFRLVRTSCSFESNADPGCILLGLPGQAWEAEYDSVNNKKLVTSLRRPSKPQVSALSHHHENHRSAPNAAPCCNSSTGSPRVSQPTDSARLCTWPEFPSCPPLPSSVLRLLVQWLAGLGPCHTGGGAAAARKPHGKPAKSQAGLLPRVLRGRRLYRYEATRHGSACWGCQSMYAWDRTHTHTHDDLLCR